MTYDRQGQSREEIAQAIASERGAVLVPPYEHPWIVAGQGTVGAEIAEDAARLGVTIDQAIACASGGGLTAGIALGARDAVAGDRDLYRRARAVRRSPSLDRVRAAGSAMRCVPARSAMHCCRRSQGEFTFSINRGRLKGGLAASDEEVKAAMRFAFEVFKIVVEPGGAVALAAVLAGRIPTRDRTIAVVVSGGNADPRIFADIIKSGLTTSTRPRCCRPSALVGERDEWCRATRPGG